MDRAEVLLGLLGLFLSAITIFAIYYGPIAALNVSKMGRDIGSEKERPSDNATEAKSAFWILALCIGGALVAATIGIGMAIYLPHLK
ncbi:MAG: hypothetical protein ABR953_11355 [Candidatus Acidiferrales bacterium]|jgi:ABC-type phosphate transport system permease subunit